MQSHHWILLIVLMLAAYAVGARYPILAQKVGIAP